MRLTGRDAIDYAEARGLTLSTYSDPTAEGRDGVTVAEAREIAAEDPGLVYLDTDGVVIEAGDYVVVGSTSQDLDYGRTYADGGRLLVAWLGQGRDQRTPIDADDGSVDVYTTERDARDAYLARCDAYLARCAALRDAE